MTDFDKVVGSINRLGFFHIFGSSYRKINIYIVSVDRQTICSPKNRLNRRTNLEDVYVRNVVLSVLTRR